MGICIALRLIPPGMTWSIMALTDRLSLVHLKGFLACCVALRSTSSLIWCISVGGDPAACSVVYSLASRAGVGAQGGDLEAACNAALDSRGLGLVVPVSRGISTAADPGRAAKEFRDRINAARVSGNNFSSRANVLGVVQTFKGFTIACPFAPSPTPPVRVHTLACSMK